MDRLFLAMPVSLLDYQGIQNDFMHVIEGKWIPPENLHITLQFFSDKFEKDFLIDTLYKLEMKADPSELKGLDLLKTNKILYAKTDNPSLYALHEQIQKAFCLRDEQAFIPHVSLMRIKKIQHDTLLRQRLELYDKRILGMAHAQMDLMQSHLHPDGARYSCVQKFIL